MFLVSIVTALSIVSFAPTYAQATTIQLCMVLDGSGSISPSEWTIILNGVANAITNNLPHDGTIELSLVQFGYSSPTYAQLEISPTVITNANYAAVAAAVQAITQSGGSTPMAHGIALGWSTITGSPNFGTFDKQIMNMATDGSPNVRNNAATTDLDGDGFVDYWDDVIASTDTAETGGLDEFDMEGIGISDTNRDWFKDWVVRPQPGHVAPPFTPGWIRVVTDASEFADTIGEKFEAIAPPEEAVGGTIIPMNLLMVTAPWIILAVTAFAAVFAATRIPLRK